jgi:glycosyltransferase involved in cell wall biosynthesis
MKVLLISHSDNLGGANKASFRLFSSLYKKIYVEVLCRYKTENSRRINKIIQPKLIISKIRDRLGNLTSKLYLNHEKIKNLPYLSGNWIYSNWSDEINKSNFDIINTHWIGSETISIRDLSKIKKPLVMTLHDMWMFCGMEHYYNLDQFEMNFRWMSNSKVKKKYFFDLSKFVFNKKRSINNIHHIVTPSRWLANYCSKSLILKKKKITVIPNPVDTNIFKPQNPFKIKKKLNIKNNEKVILYGSSSSLDVEAKGFHKLLKILTTVNKITKHKIKFIIFGDTKKIDQYTIPLSTINCGYIKDTKKLIELYSIADTLVMPSVLDNLPQIATEGQSCGCPIVAFETGGLPEIVDHNVNGFLTKKFDTRLFAKNIEKIFDMNGKNIKKFRNNARQKAKKEWDKSVISEKYIKLYKKILNETNK